MPVLFNGVGIRPYPQATLTQNTQKIGDGRVIGTTVTAVLNGTITATKTNDTETPLSIEFRLAAIIAKQTQLVGIFSTSGWLEIQGYDGSAPIKFQAVVDSIEFEPGPWVDKCDYTIQLSGEALAGSGNGFHIESASDNWQFEEAEGPHTYRGTHNVQAKGKSVPGSDIPSWQHAKDFVLAQLGIGWNGLGPWAPTNGNTLFNNGQVKPDAGTNPYNQIVSETVDEIEGTYSVTESFFLSKDPYWEEYTVSVHKELTDPKFGNIVSISGTIHGLTTVLHDIDQKIANAKSRWGTIKGLLYSRASAYVPEISLNIINSVGTVDYNLNEGTLSYQYEYNDRALINDTTEFYNVSYQTSLEDNKTVVTVEGTVTGEMYTTDTWSNHLRYDRALAQWNLVKNSMFTRAFNESPIKDLQIFPVSASTTQDKQNGTISYNFSFDNRIPEKVKNDFTVSSRYSREAPQTVVTIEGSITGLRSPGGDPFLGNVQYERYNNAVEYYNTVKNNIIGLAATYVDISGVNPLPFSKSVSHIPNGGQVSYQYEFNNVPLPCVQNALSENITITDDKAVPVIAIIPVLGRKLGPVLQDIGSNTEKRRTVTVEIVMPVDIKISTCSPADPPGFDITRYAPSGTQVYLTQDQTAWTPSNGHLARTVSWIYE